jgi:hypothetical protein
MIYSPYKYSVLEIIEENSDEISDDIIFEDPSPKCFDWIKMMKFYTLYRIKSMFKKNNITDEIIDFPETK